MARKSKSIKKEKKEAQERLAEIERLEIEAQKEEKKKLDDATEAINKICDESNIFCGVVLSTPDLLKVVQLAIESEEEVSIPFRIYYKE